MRRFVCLGFLDALSKDTLKIDTALVLMEDYYSLKVRVGVGSKKRVSANHSKIKACYRDAYTLRMEDYNFIYCLKTFDNTCLN